MKYGYFDDKKSGIRNNKSQDSLALDKLSWQQGLFLSHLQHSGGIFFL